MLVFVSGIRHPDICENYPFMLQLVERTLKSICAQTNPDFRVVVTCNQLPNISYDKEHVEFIEIDAKPAMTRQEREHDKELKYLTSFQKAISYNPSHIMIFDCDDLIHNELSQLVADNPHAPGWYFDTGYIANADCLLYSEKTENFHLHNGSSNIIRTDLLNEEVNESADFENGSSRIFHDHKHHVTRYGAHPNKIIKLPFPGAVWILGTGMNLSGLDFFGMPKISSKSFRKTFALPPLSTSEKLTASLYYIWDITKKCFRKAGILEGKWGNYGKK